MYLYCIYVLHNTPWFWNCENTINLFLSIFLELSEGNVSKSDYLGMSQDVTVIDCKAGQTSSKSNIDINAEVMKQCKLSYMYSKKVYLCSHCLMSICGENTYRKHVGNCSKYKCGKCNKTFFS